MKGVTLIISSFFVIINFSFSQVVKAELKNDSMRIGEHNRITLTFKDKFNKIPDNLAFPELEKDKENKIEFLRSSETQKNDIVGTDSVQFVKHFDIIVFDSGYYAIPPIKVKWFDTVKKSNPLLLYVRTVPVDTTENFKDIKPIYDAKYSFADRLEALKKWAKDNWILLTVSGIALLAILTLLIVLLRRNKNTVEVAIQRPAHELAFERLQVLEDKNLWKQGKEKEYYSELTEILRRYLEERYNVRALESTTSQIKHEFRWVNITEDQKKEMITLLQLADLVKFAKEKPVDTDNESSIDRVRRFVKETQLKEDDKENQDNQQS